MLLVAASREALSTGGRALIVERQQRRISPRVECRGAAELHRARSDGESVAKVLDMSVDGCLVELEAPLLVGVGEPLEISFSVNQLPFRVRAEVRVVRGIRTLGFQFVKLSVRARRRLSELMEELMEDRQNAMCGACGKAAGIELAPVTRPEDRRD